VRSFARLEEGPGLGYYRVLTDASGEPFIRSLYVPDQSTVTLAVKVPEALRSLVTHVRWRWRAQTFPRGGDECRAGATDSAADVYLTFKTRLRWYTLKYVWSSVGKKGVVCDQKRFVVSSQDTIVLESGPPANEWRDEEIDVRGAFRAHFKGGDANADVPDFVGLGILSDGDATHSESSADYARFVLVY